MSETLRSEVSGKRHD